MVIFNLEAEMSLVRKLQALDVSCQPFEGVTTKDERMVKVRKAILDNQVQSVIFKTEAGKHILLAHQFQKAYGEAL